MKCVISGSFRKFYKEITRLIEEFDNLGVEVLSPKKSKIINPDDEFVLLETDSRGASIKQIEEDHLKAIRNSNFLYVCNPNGYVGNSATMEIGFAIANKIPIYSLEAINDLTLSQFVVVASPEKIMELLK